MSDSRLIELKSSSQPIHRRGSQDQRCDLWMATLTWATTVCPLQVTFPSTLLMGWCGRTCSFGFRWCVFLSDVVLRFLTCSDISSQRSSIESNYQYRVNWSTTESIDRSFRGSPEFATGGCDISWLPVYLKTRVHSQIFQGYIDGYS